MAKTIEKLVDCNAHEMMQKFPMRTKLEGLILLIGPPGVGKGVKSQQICALDRAARESHKTIIGRVPVSGLIEWHKKSRPISELGNRFNTLEKTTGNLAAKGNLYPDSLVLEVIAKGIAQRAEEERKIILIDAPRNTVQIEQIISWGLPVKAIIFGQSLLRTRIRVFMRSLQDNARPDDAVVEDRFKKHAEALHGMVDVLNEHNVAQLHCDTEQSIATQLLSMAEFMGYDRRATIAMSECLKHPQHPLAIEIREMQALEALAEEELAKEQKPVKGARTVRAAPTVTARAGVFA